MYQKSKKGLLLLSLIVFTILCQTMVINANAADNKADAAEKKLR